MKNYNIRKWTGLLAMLPTLAFAQASGSHGGGEDGVFKGIRDEIGTWMQKNIDIQQLEQKLKLENISGCDLNVSFTQAKNEVSEKVIFTHDEIKFGNNSRICKNENKVITCNIDAWNKTRGDTRYMIVLHEYLGVAGLETNVEVDYSRYPISSKILGFVKTNDSFELGMAPSGRGRDIYFCNQVVKPLTKNSTTISNHKKVWAIQSHVISVFSGGSFPTIISLDGVNDLTLAKTGDLDLGKPKDGFDSYNLGFDSGEADEWGATVLLEKGLLTGTLAGTGEMIFRAGTESSSENASFTDTAFECSLNESSVWKDSER